MNLPHSNSGISPNNGKIAQVAPGLGVDEKGEIAYATNAPMNKDPDGGITQGQSPMLRGQGGDIGT